MKKMFALILAITLVASMAIPAFADGNTTTLTTTVPEAEYTMTIPADMTIAFGTLSETIGNLDVTAVKGFAVGKNVKVTITYAPFACASTSTTIPYQLKISYANANSTVLGNTTTMPSGDAVLFTGRNGNRLAPIHEGAEYSEYRIAMKAESADWGAALAGSYTSTITFSAAVVAAE